MVNITEMTNWAVDLIDVRKRYGKKIEALLVAHAGVIAKTADFDNFTNSLRMASGFLADIEFYHVETKGFGDTDNIFQVAIGG